MLSAESVAPLKLRPMRRGEYDRLVGAGVFAGERVQLIEGTLIEMSPQGADHSGVVERLTHLFVSKLGQRCRVRVQLPFAASDDSEPEPDVALVPVGEHFEEHPGVAYLVIEVAGDSRAVDLVAKVRVYARAKVPEYWVIDLVKREVVVHRRPRGGRYGSVSRVRPGRQLAPLEFPELKLDAAFLLPD